MHSHNFIRVVFYFPSTKKLLFFFIYRNFRSFKRAADRPEAARQNTENIWTRL